MDGIGKDRLGKDSIGEDSIKNKKQISGINALIDSYTTNEELKQRLKDFVEMRVAIKKKMTDNAFKLLLGKLDKLEKEDDRKIMVLEQSILNSWAGVFPLKDEKNNKKNSESDIDYVNV